MHKELSLYYGVAMGVLYIFCLVGMLVAMLIIHRLISEEKKKDRKAMRGQPNLRRFGHFQGIPHAKHSMCVRIQEIEPDSQRAYEEEYGPGFRDEDG